MCIFLSFSISLYHSSHVCLSLLILISLHKSVSLHFCLYLFSFLSLSLLIVLSFFSFTTPLCLSFLGLSLSLSLSLLSSSLNSLTMFTRSVGSLSVGKSLTCPESQSARAVDHSFNGELLASRRKNLYKCCVVCGCGGCCCCCVVCCVVLWWGLWLPFKQIHGYSCHWPARGVCSLISTAMRSCVLDQRRPYHARESCTQHVLAEFRLGHLACHLQLGGR